MRGVWDVSAAEDAREVIRVFTDGACSGNPGPGGWGAVLLVPGEMREISGFEAQTTNNRMELTAVERALAALNPGRRVAVYTDSRYVQQGISTWIENWKRKGWRTASGKAVKNQDLWRILDANRNVHEVDWNWVRGHAGHRFNERADQLACEAVKRCVGVDLTRPFACE